MISVAALLTFVNFSTTGLVYPRQVVFLSNTSFVASNYGAGTLVRCNLKTCEGKPFFLSSGDPWGLCKGANNTFILTEQKDGLIKKINASGTIKKTWGPEFQLPEGRKIKLNRPQAACEDSRGNLFIADTGNHQIIKVDLQNKVSIFFGENKELKAPADLKVDRNNNIFVADTGNSRVLMLSEGKIKKQFGPELLIGTEKESLEKPYGIAISKAGDVFIADTFHNRILKIKLGATTGEVISTEVSKPEGLAIADDGTIAIANTFSNAIQIVTKKSQYSISP